MAVARFPTQPQPRPIPGGYNFNPMQAIFQIITSLMQVMLSQFQGGGGGFQQPYNPFGGYGPQQPGPLNFYGGGGAGGGGYLV